MMVGNVWNTVCTYKIFQVDEYPEQLSSFHSLAHRLSHGTLRTHDGGKALGCTLPS